jgi:2-furoyl-CoA dehydrogenase large subunit
MFGLHPPFVHFVATSLIPHCVGPSERARYVGEPVAVIVAKDRYLAEDALALINVDYRPLPAVVDPEAALHENAPVLHTGLGTNRVHHRSFRYGDPERAFAPTASYRQSGATRA